ncbi:MAG: putative transporter [Burkholderia sp.]|jgi:C4-dicarboxylate transporter, DcuC family
MKMSVATAMLIGSMYAVIVTRSDPQEVTRRFFDGMGAGYAKILGIIIAAGVFAAGLKAAGVIDVLVDALTHANEWAKIGGAVGPYVLGLLTGSGDAATFAFNEAVTPHAAEFGLSVPTLGYLAFFAGCFGRISSPLCGGLILVAGIAAVSPLDIVKRTAPCMIAALALSYFLF